MKLRYKMTLSVVALSLLVIAVMALFYTNFLYEDKLEQVQNKLLYSSSDVAFHVQNNLIDNLNMLKTMQSADIVEQTLIYNNSKYKDLTKEDIEKKNTELNKIWMKANKNSPFVKQYTQNSLAQYLKRQRRLFPGLYGEIFITDRYGALVASTDKLTTFKHDQKYWWQECYDFGYGKIFFDDRGYDDSVRDYVLGIVFPIRKNGAIIGIIKANVKIQTLLSNTIDKYNKLGFAIAKIVRSKGLVVYEEGHRPLSTRVSLGISKRLEILRKGVFYAKDKQKEKIVAYSPIRLSMDNEDIVFGGKKRSIDHLLGNDGEIWHVVIEKDKKEVLASIWPKIKSLINIGIGFVFLLSLVLYIVLDKVSYPLRRLSDIANRVGKGERDISIEYDANDEVGELARSFRHMLSDLKKTTASRDELEAEIQKRIEAEKELRRQDEILIAQSKQAAMGEMIGMIAHQWRQPISVMAMAVNNILVDIELDELKEDSVKECADEILNETKYLSNTIDDFRNFFKPNKERDEITAEKLFDDVVKIIGKSLENNNIKLNFSGDLKIVINTYTRELLQVFINLINNAKDALTESGTEDKEVCIGVRKDKNSIIFEFCDNGGGINEDIFGKIFEPYFSTKENKNGTGLGLYMSKIVVEKHMLGKIWAENRENGVCFMVKLPTNFGEDCG